MNTLECTENDILKYRKGGDVMLLGRFQYKNWHIVRFVVRSISVQELAYCMILYLMIMIIFPVMSIQSHVCSMDNLGKKVYEYS